MKAKTFLKSFRLENFKAIQKSGTVKFTPLTVLIGNNGSGKSSLVEGLETYRSIVIDGLDTAMQRWFGMNHIWSKRVRHKIIGLGLANETYENPIRFSLSGRTPRGMFRSNMTVNAEAGLNAFFIQEESVETPEGLELVRDRSGTCLTKKGDKNEKPKQRCDPGESIMPPDLRDVIGKWQFLSLSPDPMGRPTVKKMAGNGAMVLNRDGSNLAQYLLNIRTKDTAAFDGIVEAMRFVLDYARNVEPVETREIQPTMYLKMLEQLRDESIEIPGWLISTGTIRILALLAVLRNPDPPPLLVVEEIENGLDPRSLNLVLEEIRTAVQAGETQIILTTHSPYFLDLLDLSHLVLCERVDGVPVFKRTSDMKIAREWAKSFAPGRLYIMDRLHVEDQS